MLAYDCFLSHDWGKDEDGRDNHARVAKICAGLKAAGLRPWFDEERMQGECKGPAAPCTLSDSVTHTLTRSRVARFCHRVGMFMPPSSALSTLEIKSWQRIQICQAQVIPQTVVCRRRRGADGGAASSGPWIPLLGAGGKPRFVAHGTNDPPSPLAVALASPPPIRRW